VCLASPLHRVPGRSSCGQIARPPKITSASDCPRAGFKKLTGTSVGSSARSSISSSMRWPPIAHADERPAAQLHAVAADQLAGLGPLVPAMAGHHLVEVGAAVSRLCCSGGHRPRQPASLVVVSSPALTATLSPVALTVHELQDARECPLVGPLMARTMQNSDAPSAAVSRAAVSTSSVSRNGVAFTACQSASSGSRVAVSGHRRFWPTDALDLHLGAAPRQADLVGERARAVTPSRAARQCGELRGVEEAALVEERTLAAATRARCSVVSGSWAAVAPMRWGWPGGSKECYGRGGNWLSGHGAHGSGRRSMREADRARVSSAMAWDFSTEPEFEASSSGCGRFCATRSSRSRCSISTTSNSWR